jgi:predicted Zn-dependent peptidase
MTVVPLPLEQNHPGDTLIHGADGGSEVRRSVLPGGVRVLTEAMPGQRSATIGFWVGVGSRDEAPGQHGSTHFLEHLLFKGTKRRTALEIASAFDEVGGESNAATAKESTCYFARVLDTDLPMAIDVIADMITGAVLDPAEMEQERDVILEEIAMDSDDPTDVAHEHFVAAVLGTHPLGRPIGGTPDAIRAVARDSVWDHYRRYYRPDELVITAAGGLEHDVVCRLVVDALHSAGWSLEPGAAPVERRSTARAQITGTAGLHVVTRPVEQANIIMGCPTIVATDERRDVMSVLNAVLGGGMSSRLFQEIREKRGLVYSVYSYHSQYTEAGLFSCYAGTTPARAQEVIGLLRRELEDVAEGGLTAEEFDRAKGHVKGSMVLSLEDPGSRMSRIGKSEIAHGEILTVNQSLKRVEDVTLEDARRVAKRVLSQPMTLTVLGPFGQRDLAGVMA